jgi:hypothetical protein
MRGPIGECLVEEYSLVHHCFRIIEDKRANIPAPDVLPNSFDKRHFVSVNGGDYLMKSYNQMNLNTHRRIYKTTDYLVLDVSLKMHRVSESFWLAFIHHKTSVHIGTIYVNVTKNTWIGEAWIVRTQILDWFLEVSRDRTATKGFHYSQHKKMLRFWQRIQEPNIVLTLTTKVQYLGNVRF